MSEKQKIAIVNIITFLRVVGTCFLPIIISILGPLGVALYIASLYGTDWIDGKLARKWEVSTIFGSILDVISDKLLEIATFLYLATFNPIMYIPVSLEILTALTNTYYGSKGSDVKSSKMGKRKTFIIGAITVLAVLSTISLGVALPIIMSLLGTLTIITEVVTLKDYIKTHKTYLKENPPKKKKQGKRNLKKPKQMLKDLFSPQYHKDHINEPMLDKLCEEEPVDVIFDNKESKYSEIHEDVNGFTTKQRNKLKISFNLLDSDIDILEELFIKQNIPFEEITEWLKSNPEIYPEDDFEIFLKNEKSTSKIEKILKKDTNHKNS